MAIVETIETDAMPRITDAASEILVWRDMNYPSPFLIG
jgi:hypothetical protein